MNEEAISRIFEYPIIILAGSVVLQGLATYAGYLLRSKDKTIDDKRLSDLDTAHSAALTLLALVIGFTFSLAASRYDQRKNYEEAEANAIGTEYLRVDALPSGDAQKLKALLKAYTRDRILFYETTDGRRLEQIAADTARLQKEMWSGVVGPASAPATAVTSLAVWGMNDVLNSQGYTYAAWSYRVPAAAWVFMEAMAVICNLLFGYKSRGSGKFVLMILPVITVLSFSVIADIDNPRRGVIRVVPQNLILTLRSMN